MKLYDIVALADHDYGGFRYRNVRFLIYRVGTRKWNLEQAQLCTDPYTIFWVERHLFTAEEADVIKRNLERIGGFSEIRIEEVPLPVEGSFRPADVYDDDVGQDSWLLSEEPEWDGPKVKADFNVGSMEPVNPFEILEPRLDKLEATLQELLQRPV